MCSSKDSVRVNTADEIKRISSKEYQESTSPKMKAKDRENLEELKRKFSHPLLLISKASIYSATAKLVSEHKIEVASAKSKSERRRLSNTFLASVRKSLLTS